MNGPANGCILIVGKISISSVGNRWIISAEIRGLRMWDIGACLTNSLAEIVLPISIWKCSQSSVCDLCSVSVQHPIHVMVKVTRSSKRSSHMNMFQQVLPLDQLVVCLCVRLCWCYWSIEQVSEGLSTVSRIIDNTLSVSFEFDSVWLLPSSHSIFVWLRTIQSIREGHHCWTLKPNWTSQCDYGMCLCVFVCFGWNKHYSQRDICYFHLNHPYINRLCAKWAHSWAYSGGSVGAIWRFIYTSSLYTRKTIFLFGFSYRLLFPQE